jgi:rhamnulose-1-phosphate aldolase
MSHGLLLNEKVKTIISEVAEVAKYLWEKGWAERNAGNISVNITGLLPKTSYYFDDCVLNPFSSAFPLLNKNIFLLTATGIRMRDLAKSPETGLCLIQIDAAGNGFRMAEFQPRLSSRQKLRPTSELPTHMAIQEMLTQIRPEMKVVVHSHVPEFIALSQIAEFKSANAINKLLFSMHPETKMFVPLGIGFVPYSLPGTESIAKATVKELETHHVVVWEKHGLLATGNSVIEAFDTMDLLTKSAKIFLLCKDAGYTPEGLTDKQIDEIPKLS